MSDPAPTTSCPLTVHPSPVVRAGRLISLTVERPDLERVERFFRDFGLNRATGSAGDVLHLCGGGFDAVSYTAIRGSKPRLIGFAFEGTASDLEDIAAETGAAIEPHAGPGGGRKVTVTDPAGRQIEVIAGQSKREPIPGRSPTAARPSNTPVRLEPRPPIVRCLGHVALEAVAFEATVDFYTRLFGLIPSDVQLLPDGEPALVFLRCNRGATPADHHVLVISRSVRDTLNHAAFEVDDVDAVAMGHRVLREAGWRHAWGIGRHVYGSQVFDYWRDPWGDLVEHYADGDRFDASVPPGVCAFGRREIAQWGPPMPPDFVDTRLSPSMLWTVLKALRTSPEVTIRRVLALKKAMSH